jgi:6-phosphogluconolactonase
MLGITSLALWLTLSAPRTPAASGEESKGDKMWLFVGTYTEGRSKGIYRFDLDAATGKLSDGVLAVETVNPSFLAIHPNQQLVYAVNEISNFAGAKNAGAVSAFALDPRSGDLTLLNAQSTEGAGPCHLVVDKQGKNVLAANYGGGSVCVLPIEANGALAKASAFIQHHGTSANPQRQEAPHAHSVNLDAANRFAFVADLGLDKVFIYRFDGAQGTLTPNDPSGAAVEPGSGPRHFAFHPSDRYAYVINELKSTVTAFAYDADKGSLKTLQTTTTIPAEFAGKSWTAEVQVHPSGRFLYGSNRGHNSIAIFNIEEASGKLTFVGWQGHHIKTPRNFVLDPEGKFLFVANQDGDSIVVFAIDAKTGKLTPTGAEVEVSKPVCLRMMKRP